MDYILVALMTIAGEPSMVEYVPVAYFKTKPACEHALKERVKPRDVKGYLCAKKDYN
jgi:hypothetical protein